MIHLLYSTCKVDVVVSCYVCVPGKKVFSQKLYSFRRFHSRWVKSYAGNLSRSELNGIDVFGKQFNDTEIVTD